MRGWWQQGSSLARIGEFCRESRSRSPFTVGETVGSPAVGGFLPLFPAVFSCWESGSETTGMGKVLFW